MGFKALIWLQQIRGEFEYHNIQLYPFDSEEHDDEEVELNQTIKVGLSYCIESLC